MKRSEFKHIKVGTKLKIRNDLIDGEPYGSNSFVDTMTEYLGKWVMVSYLVYPPEDCGFYINGLILYGFTIEMVEHTNRFKYGK